jgi:ABC-type enterochelin transport system permease subunit
MTRNNKSLFGILSFIPLIGRIIGMVINAEVTALLANVYDGLQSRRRL